MVAAYLAFARGEGIEQAPPGRPGGAGRRTSPPRRAATGARGGGGGAGCAGRCRCARTRCGAASATCWTMRAGMRSASRWRCGGAARGLPGAGGEGRNRLGAGDGG